eukprot:3938743-Pleurochrysis_carterae.AAC.1
MSQKRRMSVATNLNDLRGADLGKDLDDRRFSSPVLGSGSVYASSSVLGLAHLLGLSFWLGSRGLMGTTLLREARGLHTSARIARCLVVHQKAV